jgi:hypothetical protein
MKKLITILVLLFIFKTGFSQPIANRTTGANTVGDPRLFTKLNLFIPRYADTTAANSPTNIGIDSCGAIIFTYDVNGMWVRQCNPKKWARAGSSSRFGFSGEDVTSTSNRTFANGVYAFTQTWTSPTDATKVLQTTQTNFGGGFAYHIQSNWTTGGGLNPAYFISVGTGTTDGESFLESGIVIDAGNDFGEHKAIQVRTDSLTIGSPGRTGVKAIAIVGTIFDPTLALPNLKNGTSQNRLLGQTSTDKQVGYITLGAGLSLSSGVLSASGSGITIGTTTITSGTTTRILYDNAGVVGEYTLTGSGTVVAMQTAPTFITSITAPLHIGGTAANSTLELRTTSGVGTSDIWKATGGSNGGTTLIYALAASPSVFFHSTAVADPIGGTTNIGAQISSGVWGIGLQNGPNPYMFLGVDGSSMSYLRVLTGSGTFFGTTGGSSTNNLFLQTGNNVTAAELFLSGGFFIGGTTSDPGDNNLWVQEQIRTKQGSLNVAVGGALKDFYTDVSNGTTVETDLYTYTTPANTLSANGEKLTAEYTVDLSDATADKTIKVYFAGTQVFTTGSIAGATGDFKAVVTIIRVSSTVVRVMVAGELGGFSQDFANYIELTGLTLSGTNILKITGQASGATGGTGDLVAKLGAIFWVPAAAN